MSEPVDRRAVRARLRDWGSTGARIRRLERDIREYERYVLDARETLRSPVVTDMPRTRGSPRDMTDIIAEIQRREQLYADRVHELRLDLEEIFRRPREIDRIVDRLSENQQRVLWERYVERRSWQIIAIRLSYDERWVRSIEERAVDAIGRKLRGQ